MDNQKLFMNSIQQTVLGHTGFHEIQFCEKLLPIKKLLKCKNIAYWKSNSLYIEAATNDDEIFYKYYDQFFSQFGKLDYFGINYFTKEQAVKIYNDLQNESLPDVDTLINWLKICISQYNGFYFLGV